jgi:hypothetical protein
LPLYSSAEEAAIENIPPSQARVIAECGWNGYAVVLLETNDQPPFEPYHVVCHQTEGGWVSIGGSNGWGWMVLPDKETGVLAFWEEDQPGDSVRIRYQGSDHDVPVVDGYFLFCAWDVPVELADEEPYIIE